MEQTTNISYKNIDLDDRLDTWNLISKFCNISGLTIRPDIQKIDILSIPIIRAQRPFATMDTRYTTWIKRIQRS